MRVTKINPRMFVVSFFALYFLVAGVRGALHQSYDFVPVYSGVRCLLRGCNPYDIPQLDKQFLQAGGHEELLQQADGWVNESPLYPPSTFVALAPFGLLQFPAARLAWCLLNGCLFIVAVSLVLSLCPPSHPWLATALGALFLFNGAAFLKLGQASAFAASLLVISVALFLRRRYLLPAACLLALSLAVKPHIGILIALYLLTKQHSRRHAALALAGALALLLIGGAILDLRPVSAHWLSDLRSSLAISMAPGHVNDPASPYPWEIHLQAVTSILFTDGKTSTAVAYGVFLLLAAAWVVGAARHVAGSSADMVALAAIVVLSMLPVYHRQVDAAILLLTIPSLLIITEHRPALGAAMAGLTLLGSTSIPGFLNGFLTAHAPAVLHFFLGSKVLMFLVLGSAYDLPTQFQYLLGNKFVFLLILRQQNLALLLLACLYLTAMFAIAKPEPMYPEAAAFKSTRLSASSDHPRDSKGTVAPIPL